MTPWRGMASFRAVLRDQRTPHARRPDVAPELAPNLAPPPGNPRFPLFDSLRAIAALSVFLGHTVTGTQLYGQHPTIFLLAAAQVAYQGVAIFFLISGFLLYRPVPRRAPRGAQDRPSRLRAAPDAANRPGVLDRADAVPDRRLRQRGDRTQLVDLLRIRPDLQPQHDRSTGSARPGRCASRSRSTPRCPYSPFWRPGFGRNARSVRGDIVLLVILTAASLAFRAHFHDVASYAIVSTLAGTFTWFALGMGLAILSVTEESRPQGSWVTRLVVRRPTSALVGGRRLLRARCISCPVRATGGVRGASPRTCSTESSRCSSCFPACWGTAPAVLRDARYDTLGWPGWAWSSYAFYLYHTIVIEQLNKFALDAHIALRYVVRLRVRVCHLLRLRRRQLLRVRAPDHAAARVAIAAWPDRAQRGSQAR